MSAYPQTVHRDPAAGALAHGVAAKEMVRSLLETHESFEAWLDSFDWPRIGLVGRSKHSPLTLWLREKGPEVDDIEVLGTMVQILVRDAREASLGMPDRQVRYTLPLPTWAFLFQQMAREAHKTACDLDHYSMAKLRSALAQTLKELPEG